MLEAIVLWCVIIPVLAVLCVRQWVLLHRALKRCDAQLHEYERTVMAAFVDRQKMERQIIRSLEGLE